MDKTIQVSSENVVLNIVKHLYIAFKCVLRLFAMLRMTINRSSLQKNAILFILLLNVSEVFADMNLTGRWISDTLIMDTEKLIVEFTFKDSTNLQMDFYTENVQDNFGYCLSKCTVDFTYNLVGPIFMFSTESNSFNVEILRFSLFGEYSDKEIEQLKIASKKEMQKSLKLLVESLGEEGYAIFVHHLDSDTKFSLVLGDQDNNMELIMTKFDGDVVQHFFDTELPSPKSKPFSKKEGVFESVIKSKWFYYFIAFCIWMVYQYFKNRNKNKKTLDG